MRVIAGIARSLLLKAPAGLQTRPTVDRIKETLFNMLQSDIPGAVFVDIFSGSGGIGIEALSRGAKKAYLCDNSYEAIRIINQNVEKTRVIENPTEALSVAVEEGLAWRVQISFLFFKIL